MKLKSDQFELLGAVVRRRAPALNGLVHQLKDSPAALSDADRESLRQVVADELCDLGLRQDDEPNEYGLQLEDVIDGLGHQ